LEQNSLIGNFIQALDEKPLLKALELKSNYWSLEALSRGFSKLKMKNQLVKLRFEGSDDTITSNEKSWRRIEGLCNFIKNQKESLKILQVSLPFVFEENIVTHIAEAISKVPTLKELNFSVNPSFSHNVEEIQRYYENTLQDGILSKDRKVLKISKTWNPNLAKCMKRLENLESFNLRFDIAHAGSAKWSVDVMNVLPTLESLRNIRISSDSAGMLLKKEQKIIKAVVELRNIRKIEMIIFDIDYHLPSLMNLQLTLNRVNKRQSLKCNLLF